MKSRQFSVVSVSLSLLIFGFLAYGFFFSDACAQSGKGYPVLIVERIGVVPFFQGRYGSSIGETLTCPICQLGLDPEGMLPIAGRVLSDYVHEALQIRFGDKVVPLPEVRDAFEEVPKDETKETPLSIAQALGTKLKADVMALGTVWQYRERAGGAAAVDRPAAVAFAVFLVDVKTGKTLWQASFSETQQSLSENVLEAKGFFKKGGRWLSASELAKYGVQEVFTRFPW